MTDHDHDTDTDKPHSILDDGYDHCDWDIAFDDVAHLVYSAVVVAAIIAALSIYIVSFWI